MQNQRAIKVGTVNIGEGQGLAVITGPCAIESLDKALSTAAELKAICTQAELPFIYKSSFDKANRSSITSYRGPGLDEGLRILQQVKQELDIAVVTDIHEAHQAAAAAEVCDLIQIPAFLCRQTDLLNAAAQTGLPVHVKKGQFMAPWEMKNVVNKLRECGCTEILVTDRGSSFGYNNLVSDFRSIPLMKELGVPVCFDATHSVQIPGGKGTCSGGQREFVPTLSRAAVAAGCDCLYIESHPSPDDAPCDGPNMLAFSQLLPLFRQLKKLHEVVNEPCFAEH